MRKDSTRARMAQLAQLAFPTAKPFLQSKTRSHATELAERRELEAAQSDAAARRVAREARTLISLSVEPQ